MLLFLIFKANDIINVKCFTKCQADICEVDKLGIVPYKVLVMDFVLSFGVKVTIKILLFQKSKTPQKLKTKTLEY